MRLWYYSGDKEKIMNNNVKILAVGAAAFIIGMSVNNAAFSDTPCTCKFGVVNVQQVVANSTQYKKIQDQKVANTKELVAYIEKARKDVASVSDEKKKKALEDKYNKEYSAKKAKMEKDLSDKLKAADNALSKTIDEQSKAGGYKMVFAKGIVLYGGEDITDKVIKAVK